jgi:pyruvate carboxylase
LQTNVPFLLNVVDHDKIRSGVVDTYFIDENPQLFHFSPSLNRGQKLLKYLGEIMVNGPLTPLGTTLKPSEAQPKCPPVPFSKYQFS